MSHEERFTLRAAFDLEVEGLKAAAERVRDRLGQVVAVLDAARTPEALPGAEHPPAGVAADALDLGRALLEESEAALQVAVADARADGPSITAAIRAAAEADEDPAVFWARPFVDLAEPASAPRK